MAFVVSPQLIEKQLHRILSSPKFDTTDRLKAFLKYVVEETLSERTHEIKGYTIATTVFGRSSDFNPKTDPIVSIEANRLRRALLHYYLTAGKMDSILIEIPKGTYVPKFRKRSASETDTLQGTQRDVKQFPAKNWPTLLMVPFENLTGDPDLNYLATGLAMEIAIEISIFQDIRVLLPNPMDQNDAEPNIDVHFKVNGSIRKDETRIKFSLHLSEAANGSLIWNDAYSADFGTVSLITFQEKVAKQVAAKIIGEHAVLSRTMATEACDRPLNDLVAYEAMLRYYHFDMFYSPDAYVEAFKAITQATKRNPDCGLIWSMLGRLYAVNTSLELMAFETSFAEALAFAEKGVALNPDNLRAQLILAFCHFFCSDLQIGRSVVEQALSQYPNTLLLRENIGYLLTLLGDFDRGPALIREAIELNPYYSIIVHHALCLESFYQKKLRAGLY